MFKNAIIICALLAVSAFANHCTDFAVVNITTNDSTLHFSQMGLNRGEITNGNCWYDTDLFGSGVTWQCTNMYLIKGGKSIYIHKRNGEFSQKQFMFFCESNW